MLVLTFLAVMFVFWRRGREEHYPEDELFDAFFTAGFWGVIVSRAAFILLHFQTFQLHFWSWLDVINSPGFQPVFGLLVFAWMLYRVAQRQKWNGYEVLDFASMSTALGLALSWVGNFLAGTGFGNPTTLPIGMNFPGVFDKRQPTQIYGMILFFLLFVFLNWAELKYRTFSWYRDKRHSAQTGFLFGSFCIGYGLIGVILSVLMPAQFTVMKTGLDIPLYLVIFVFGIYTIFQRSGRTLSLHKAKVHG